MLQEFVISVFMCALLFVTNIINTDLITFISWCFLNAIYRTVNEFVRLIRYTLNIVNYLAYGGKYEALHLVKVHDTHCIYKYKTVNNSIPLIFLRDIRTTSRFMKNPTQFLEKRKRLVYVFANEIYDITQDMEKLACYFESEEPDIKWGEVMKVMSQLNGIQVQTISYLLENSSEEITVSELDTVFKIQV
jgi:hypothetical protein